MSRNFNSFIDAFTEYAIATGSPEKYARWSAISGISAALERRSWFWLGERVIFPNQFILLVGGSGTRKSATADLILDIVYGLEEIAFMPNQMTAAALIQSISEAGQERTFQFGGETFKNSSLFAYASEAATMLKDNEQLQELLTDFYGCGTPTFWSNKFGWAKRTIGNGKTVVFNPCLNLLGCSTAEWLRDVVGERSIKGGFIPRFLLIEHKDTAKPLGWSHLKKTSVSKHKRKMLSEDLNKINKLSGEFKASDDFDEVFDKIEKTIVDQINLEDDKQPFYNRKLVHCIKIAMVLSADESDKMIVTGEHLSKAFALVESVEEDIYSCFYEKGANKSIGQFVDCWETIRKKPSWKKSEILNATIKKCNPAELDQHLKALFQMGRITMDTSEKYVKYVVTDSSPIK